MAYTSVIPVHRLKASVEYVLDEKKTSRGQNAKSLEEAVDYALNRAKTEQDLFESAIDLLSYATLQKLDGKEWRREHLLSLAGVYQPAKEIEKSKVPAALVRTLKMHPEVKTIVLHLDNDRIGRLATKAISAVLPKQYQVKDVPPKQGKDYNDLLCIKLNLAITKREKRTKKNMSGHEKYER